MSLKQKNTAILVFARDPKSEAEHKVFAEHLGFKGNQRLAKVLNQRITKLCQKTNIPTFIHSSAQQKGDTFGIRIANAFESIFDQGYENVIAVGNDCLSISTDTIRDTKDKLRQNEIVLGPAKDGGLYLIGLSKSAFRKKQFTNFNWTTEYLTLDFLNFADQFDFGFEVLKKAADLDNASDFKIAIKSLSSLDILIKTLEHLFSNLEKQIFFFKNNIYKFSYLRYTTLRGPPVLV